MLAIRPPRVTVTSTINTLINANPRMSSVVITTPMQLPPPTSLSQANPLMNPSQKEIGNIEYDYNRQRFISSSLSNLQNQNTNPLIAGPVQNHNLMTLPSTNTGQNTLPLTLPTQTIIQTNVNTTNTHPQRPNLDNSYEDEDGNTDWKALLIHYMTKSQTQAELSKPNTHKMNYGRVPPPILN